MLKVLIGLVIGGVLGVCAGAGGMLVAFPFLFPPAPVNERVADLVMSAMPMTVVQTRFRTDSAGQDAAHWGRGGLSVYSTDDRQTSYLLELQQDFEVGPGPNFWIYLNSVPGVETEADFLADNGRQRIAKLKSFTGSQVYPVPAELFDRAQSVTVWCETFSEYIASADLQ